MRRILAALSVALLGVPFSGNAQETIIADHTVIDEFDNIPDNWLDSARNILLLLPGESHGRAYHYGLERLAAQDDRYAVEVYWGSEHDEPAKSLPGKLRASRVYRTNRWEWWGCGEEEFFTSENARSAIKSGLSTTRSDYTGKIMFSFGWCWDMTWHNGPGGTPDPELGVRWAGSSEGSPSGDNRWGIDPEDSEQTGNEVCLQTYLDAVVSYNTTVPGITTFYTTGPVDGYSGESGYQRYLKHEAIRAWVKKNGGVLLDYADILCWDGNSLHTQTWDGHTHQTGDPDLASGGTGFDGGDGGCHITAAGCDKLGKAVWWMLARVAGWEGRSVDLRRSSSAPMVPCRAAAPGASLSVIPANVNPISPLARRFSLSGRIASAANSKVAETGFRPVVRVVEVE